ncbi:MAG: methyltransferase [Actinobacteria bacterium]|nr:methyltransferase [Actinomycetota bacterium]
MPAEQYFSARPGVATRPSTVRLALGDVSLQLRTDSGVFSATRIDPGTRLLLDTISPAGQWPPGDLVDVGCGYGPIAITLARRAPDRVVWAVDVNERARDLCRANAAAAGVADQVRVVAPEEVPTDLAVGLVASNPPIRIGKAALHELCRSWLGRLGTEGEAWWVVQRHLGSDSLQAWMSAQGWATTRIRSRQAYRVLLSVCEPGRPTAEGDQEDVPRR